jgi:hypothetical protein
MLLNVDSCRFTDAPCPLGDDPALVGPTGAAVPTTVPLATAAAAAANNRTTPTSINGDGSNGSGGSSGSGSGGGDSGSTAQRLQLGAQLFEIGDFLNAHTSYEVLLLHIYTYLYISIHTSTHIYTYITYNYH